MKDNAYLFGPFLGELSWEYFRFSPYAIYLKKEDPETKIVVFTRQSRFDLYGKYADILVPLQLEDQKENKQKAFKLIGFDLLLEKKLNDIFRVKYKKQYFIKKHFCPDTSSLRYNLKWQFPRNKMDYDFLPRDGNLRTIKKIVPKKKFFIIDEGYKGSFTEYNSITIESFSKLMTSEADNISCTYVGCLIELIKKSSFVISNLSSDVGRLSLLLKKPLIYPKRSISQDSLNLLNPYKTPVIDCDTILEGISIYEDNF